MKLTDELMQALGFVDMGNHWVDSYQVVLFKDQVPSTLLELKNLLTGTAYNKGKRFVARVATPDHLTIQSTSDTLHYNAARAQYTEARNSHL